MRLPPPPPVGMYPVRLVGANIGWGGGGGREEEEEEEEGGKAGEGGSADGGGGGAAGAVPLLRDVSLAVERTMRLVVRGPNGAGKSTLIKALADPGGALLLPKSGTAGESGAGSGGGGGGGDGKGAAMRVEEADGRLRLGYFTQDLAQDLPQDKIALDVVMEAARERHDPLLPDEEGRKVLGALGLKGPMALRKVGDLSGGEKARVALAM